MALVSAVLALLLIATAQVLVDSFTLCSVSAASAAASGSSRHQNNNNKNLPRSSRVSLASFQEPNGAGGEEASTGSPSRPRTGWNHNLPREWVDPNSSSGSGSFPTSQPTSASEGSVSNSSNDDDEPRTGWLHNTRSKETISQEKQQQQQQSSSSATTTAGGESDARKLLRLEMEKKARNHRLLGPPAFHPVGDKRVVVTEHKIAVPLSRADESLADQGSAVDVFSPSLASAGGGRMMSGPTIDVYFTVVETVESDEDEAFFAQTLTMSESTKTGMYLQNERADSYVSHSNLSSADKMILYLQGGPGFGAPAPVVSLGLGEKGSWAAEALAKGFKKVVLMDQRGTGRSTPITKQTLEKNFPELFALDDIAQITENDEYYRQSTGAGFASIAEQLDRWEAMNPELAARVGVGIGQAAEYMANFRADNIVKDAEAVKTALLVPSDGIDNQPRPWGAALGQSFGGFCMMSYLSLVPHPPKICLFTGGIAPMLTRVDDAYTRLWDRVKERNLQYYDKYPADIPLVKRIVQRLLAEPVLLPSGGRLTARRFLQLGLGLGGSPSAFASMHSFLASAFVDDDEDEFTRAFLKRVDSEQSFDDHPIYFLMHESIYADGHFNSPTDWSAHRTFQDLTETPSEFSYELTSSIDSVERPTLFSGEMVFPWMADGDYAELSGFGMRALAQSLACKDDWAALYNKENMRKALAPGGPCKAAAAVYYDDMYVDFDCSMMVAARGGPLEHCKIYVTNEYQHSGLRDDGANIFGKLLGMAKGSIRTPS